MSAAPRARSTEAEDGRRRDLRRPPAPEPLPLPVVDNHTHLDIVDGDDLVDVEELLARAAETGVPHAVQIGCDLPAARWTVQAVERYPALLGGVALHPNEAPVLAAAGELDAALEEIAELARHPRVRVVGETGLDYYRTGPEGVAAQQESFRRHIRLAKELGLALQIHDRDAHDDVLRILAEEGAPERTVFHCFSGDAEMARVCGDAGYYLSFAGNITFKNAEPLREALRAAPQDRLLVETDAPFLTPAPHRGRPNASYLVPVTVRAMAEVTGADLEELCAALGRATEEVYGTW
ncbi:TatD DNase family protein [Kineococcus xinjiangensis]|uniref:TatD DNase family protein n=1 Tax=Kineococcus xinjiangensis TaxID=512762 RepID=A0A2S6ISX0_9ACTN|nr:TatD family hydrolase [Kineococcus xinjiangensis]PPK97261.1 TatD DNase family protein [Kineococcus xinjiangensis]